MSIFLIFVLTIKAKYRVWDYPVKEQYTHILRVIEQTGPVSSPEEGIMMVSKRKKLGMESEPKITLKI